jgi:hypothetical protein
MLRWVGLEHLTFGTNDPYRARFPRLDVLSNWTRLAAIGRACRPLMSATGAQEWPTGGAPNSDLARVCCIQEGMTQ